MKMKTQTVTQHTPGAVRLAEILLPAGIDRRGRRTMLSTAYGKKTREGIADLIDNESGAPELLAVAQTAANIFRYMVNGAKKREIDWKMLASEAQSAIDKATKGAAQ